jgi:hypothetical protein
MTSDKYGSLVASPTFGLPEFIGGDRNWDYRYTWIRDASFTVFAFINLAFISAQQTVDNYPETDSSYANPGFDRKFFFGKEKTVSAENFNKGNINSPLELIAGKIPGLVISRPGSNPNEGFDVRLRGLSTVFCSTSPLIVIDDLPGGNIDNLSPDDIESISIMNSSDAAIRYGSAASGGVIFVTTKRGRSGKPLIEYNGHTSAEFLARTNPSMNSSEWRDLAGKMHAGTDFGYNTDWFRKITGPAISHSHNFAFSGGSKNTFYRASVNYYDVKGILSGTGFNRMNGRIKLNQKALKDRLSFDLNAGGTDKNLIMVLPRHSNMLQYTIPPHLFMALLKNTEAISRVSHSIIIIRYL